MKITTEFTNFGCEFSLVSRPSNNNSHSTAFPRTIRAGRYQKDKQFRKAVKETVKIIEQAIIPSS